MFDAPLRRLIDPPLSRIAVPLARAGVGPNAVTLTGLAIGLLVVPALALQAYGWALVAIAGSRICDGLDGPIARVDRRAGTDLGGYLDIVCDFLFYAAVPRGFALGRPDDAFWAALLLFSFVGTGSSFLAYAIIAAKRGINTEHRGRKAFHYLGGLTEGTETIALFVAICVFPDLFSVMALVFSVLCWITTATRIVQAWVDFR